MRMAYRRPLGVAVFGALLLVVAPTGVTVGAASSGTTDVMLSPLDDPVEPGDTVTYDIVVESASGGVGSFNVTVASNDTDVASIEDVTFADRPTFTRDEGSGDTVVLTATGMDTLDSGPVTIATVTVVTEAPGKAQLSVSVTALGDEDGQSYTVSNTQGRTLVVGSPFDDGLVGDAGDETGEGPPTAELVIPAATITNTSAGTPDGAPRVTTVAPGENVTITATFENDGEVEGDVVAWLATSDDLGQHLARQRITNLETDNSRTVQFTVAFTEQGTHTLVLSGRPIGKVHVRDATPTSTPAWATEANRAWFTRRYPHLVFETWAPLFDPGVFAHTPANVTNTSNSTTTASGAPIAVPEQDRNVDSSRRSPPLRTPRLSWRLSRS